MFFFALLLPDFFAFYSFLVWRETKENYQKINNLVTRHKHSRKYTYTLEMGLRRVQELFLLWSKAKPKPKPKAISLSISSGQHNSVIHSMRYNWKVIYDFDIDHIYTFWWIATCQKQNEIDNNNIIYHLKKRTHTQLLEYTETKEERPEKNWQHNIFKAKYESSSRYVDRCKCTHFGRIYFLKHVSYV